MNLRLNKPKVKRQVEGEFVLIKKNKPVDCTKKIIPKRRCKMEKWARRMLDVVHLMLAKRLEGFGCEAWKRSEVKEECIGSTPAVKVSSFSVQKERIVLCDWRATVVSSAVKKLYFGRATAPATCRSYWCRVYAFHSKAFPALRHSQHYS